MGFMAKCMPFGARGGPKDLDDGNMETAAEAAIDQEIEDAASVQVEEESACVQSSADSSSDATEECNKATSRMDLVKLRALPPYGNVVTGKIDGGCSTTMLSQKTYENLLGSGACEQLAPMTSTTSIYKFANGQTKKANAHIAITAEINGKAAEIHANVFDDPNTHFLLGLNFLRKHEVNIQYHPKGDRITCPALGLYDRVLPRDTAGLDVLPFFADFPPEDPARKEKAMLAARELSKARVDGGDRSAAPAQTSQNRRRKW
jgi:hypothetical protein